MDPVRISIYDALLRAGSFQSLLAGIKIAGLTDVLKNKGPWTLFAPTDAAFGKLLSDHLDSLLRSPETMCELIAFHLLPGEFTTEEIKFLPARAPVGGKRLLVCRGRIQINGAKVLEADLACSNGVLHCLDRVLLPARPVHLS